MCSEEGQYCGKRSLNCVQQATGKSARESHSGELKPYRRVEKREHIYSGQEKKVSVGVLGRLVLA